MSRFLDFVSWAVRRFNRALLGTLWLFGLNPLSRRAATLPLVFVVTFGVTWGRDGRAAVTLQWDAAVTSAIVASACFLVAFAINWALAPWRLEREARNEADCLRKIRGSRETRLRVLDLIQRGESIRGAIGLFEEYPSKHIPPSEIGKLGVYPWLYEVSDLLSATDDRLARHFDGTERFFPMGKLDTIPGYMSLVRLRLDRLREIKEELDRERE